MSAMSGIRNAMQYTQVITPRTHFFFRLCSAFIFFIPVPYEHEGDLGVYLSGGKR